MPADDDPVLADYLEEWLERRRSQLRPTTLRGYRQVVRCYLRPHLGDLPLSSLDRRCIERAYGHLLRYGGRRGSPLSARTVQYAHAVLHRALQDAMLDGLIGENPVRLARAPKHDPSDVELDDELRVWTAEDAVRFLAHVDGHYWRALWHLALDSGARRGELLGLRWEDVDLPSAQIRIRRSLSVVDGVVRLLGTKTSRNRTLSVGTSVVDALRRHCAEQTQQRETGATWRDRWGLVFTDPRGDPVDPMTVTHEFRRLVRAAPVPVIRMHDLRHTHASLLLAAGVPIKVVSDRLGHATITMTLDVYGHVLPAMDEDAAARFDQVLREGAAIDVASV